MSGILDSKSRIFDTIVTLEGRRQMSSGKLKAEFYSFSDMGTFYVQDTSLSGAVDAANRIYLEAASLPQDSITFEADDSGKLVRFPSSTLPVRNGKILIQVTGSENGSVTGKVYLPAQDIEFASMADDLLSSSLDAYQSCYIVGSPDIFDEKRSQFLLSQNQVSFTIGQENPISSTEVQEGNVETTDPLFIDGRLSHLPNFQYLPPINKARPGDTNIHLLGNYANLNQRPQLSFQDVENEINWAVERGYSSVVKFEETSKTNNLVCQVFEIGDNEITKLDVIDFGLFSFTGDDISIADRKQQQQDPRSRAILSKHVFFAGKVYTDSNNVHKFINLFTLIFD